MTVISNSCSSEFSSGVATACWAGVRCEARPSGDGLLVVRVAGELDLANATEVRRFVTERVQPERRLMLDLSEADFAGTALLPILAEVSDKATRSRVEWVLLVGRAVHRLLTAADVVAHFPVVLSFDQSVACKRAPLTQSPAEEG